jgi:hypothetical protein
MTVLATLERNAGHVFAHCGEGCGWSSRSHEDETGAAAELARHVTSHDVGKARRQKRAASMLSSNEAKQPGQLDMRGHAIHPCTFEAVLACDLCRGNLKRAEQEQFTIEA